MGAAETVGRAVEVAEEEMAVLREGVLAGRAALGAVETAAQEGV